MISGEAGMSGGTKMGGNADIAERVRSVWVEALPTIPFDAELCWRDAGLSSLKALELALRLEQALGRKVSFDGLAPDCTTNDLVRLLTQEPRASRAQRDARHQVFFVPGLEGDNPYQASFRHALRREVSFETLDVGSIDLPGRVLGDIPARAARLVETVLEFQPRGEIRLAGCSFGALVAQEMTRLLEARGRVVGVLCLIDGFLSPPIWTPLDGAQPASRLPRIAARQQWKRRLIRWTGPALHRGGAFEVVRRVVSAPAFRTRPWALAAGLRLVRAWGFRALGAWRPGTCSAPTLLVTSDEFAQFSSVEQWRSACPKLQVMAVPGRHAQLFDPPAMAILVPAFLAALAGSVAAVA